MEWFYAFLLWFFRADEVSKASTQQSIQEHLQNLICAKEIKDLEDYDMERIEMITDPHQRLREMENLRHQALSKCGVRSGGATQPDPYFLRDSHDHN